MNILFPTDFSKNSEIALDYAVDFMNRVNGSISLLHVYGVPTMESVGIGSLSNYSTGPGARLQDSVEKDKQLNVAHKLRDLAKKHGLNDDDCHYYPIKGNIRSDIDHVLESDDYDLVVLGTRGENSQRGMFFGGIANHLISSGTCPVLAVPPGAKYNDVKQIIYATDLTHDEKGSINWVINYARIHDARVRFIHVDHGNANNAEEKMKHLIEELPYDNVDYQLIPGDNVSNILVEIANDPNVDMISMTTHTTTLFNKIFHNSLTVEVLDKVKIPFLAFSEKDILPYSFD